MSGCKDRDFISNFLERLMQQIIDVNSKFTLWIHIQNRKFDRLDAMNLAPAFFSITLQSLFNDVIVSIAKIYEPHNELRKS